MKNLKIFIPLLALLLLAACADDAKLMISPNPSAPVLKTPSHVSKLFDIATGAYILNKDSASNIVETFKADSANFGVYLPVTYVLEIDKAGNNFANSKEITSSTTPSLSITVAQLNVPIASQGLLNSPSGVISSFDIRIKAKIGASFTPVYSNTQTIKVNPYPTYGLLYVPGNYQSAYDGGSWNPANPNTILYSVANDGNYEGYLDMSNGGATPNFKLTEYPDWNHTNYGAGASSTTISGTGGDIASLTSGYYKLNVNIPALTISATHITKWGVIGSFAASGWSNEINMTFDATTKLWTATGIVFAAGDKFKIRPNGDWAGAFGVESNGKFTTSSSVTDIPIPSAGTYTITLDLRQYGKPGYNVTMAKN